MIETVNICAPSATRNHGHQGFISSQASFSELKRHWHFCYFGFDCSMQLLLSHIDNAIQYGEDAEVKVKDYDPDLGDPEDLGNFDGGGFNEDEGGFSHD